MSKPILKSNPKSKKYFPPVGEHTLELSKNAFWLHHVGGHLVVSVTFRQDTETFQNLYVTLENGETVALEWVRTDRYGKKHRECAEVIKGVNPLFRDDRIIPGMLPVPVVDSTTLKTFNPESAPIRGFFWNALDCGMEKDPIRAELARKVAATKIGEVSEWTAYWVYAKTLVKTEALKGLSWGDWAVMHGELAEKQHRSNCARPAGTDGFRW